MAERHSDYSPEDIIFANLSETAERLEHICEQEIAHLRELVYEFTSVHKERTEMLAALPDLLAPHLLISCTPPPLAQNEEPLSLMLQMRHVYHKLFLCRELQDTFLPFSRYAELFFSEAESYMHAPVLRIATPNSASTDAAYSRFSTLGAHTTSVYAHSFHAACEQVYNGLCEGCILPIENTTEGTLNSFYRLIERYELKIIAACHVHGIEDDAQGTRFALIRKHLLPMISEQPPQTFELSFVEEKPNALAELLLAAQLCRLELLHTTTLPDAHNLSGRRTHRLALSVAKGNLTAFLLYLATELPNYTPIGLYSHLPDPKRKKRTHQSR